MSFPIPPDEKERLEEIEQLNLLDQLGEDAYDLITQMVADIFDAPIALITLIDEEIQWFLSKVGLDQESSPRSEAVCAYNIMDESILVVNNFEDDDRFSEMPYVKSGLKLKFYAGAPIRSPQGHLIGSVCILDYHPREIDHKEEKLLEAFAEQVGTLLRMREISAKLKETREENKQLQKLIPMCSWCKKLRDDDDFWRQVEDYIGETGGEITQAICPDCADDLNEDLDLV